MKQFFDSVANWLSTLPTNPITDFLEGGLLLLRRTFFPSTLDSPPSPVPTEPELPATNPATPTITVHNTSATETLWVYNLTNSGNYSIPADFTPVQIAPLGSAPVTLTVGTGTPGSPENRIYFVSGSAGFVLPVASPGGVDAFNPVAVTAGNSFLNYSFVEYYLYPAGGGNNEYTIDTSYIDEWSLPVQFKFATTGSGWSGAVNDRVYGFSDYDTVVSQLAAAGAPYSDLVWSGTTPFGPQPPATVSRIIGPDKVWAQQFNEPTTNYYMNNSGWVPTSYQNFVSAPITGQTNPYSYNGTLYSSTGNFNFWKDSVNGPAGTPYPIALRSAAKLNGFPADANGVSGFFTYPNDETAGQFTNIPTTVSLDIYVHGASDGLSDSVIPGGKWLYSAPTNSGVQDPDSRITLTGTDSTDTFILNYMYKRANQAPIVIATGSDHDIIGISDANWPGATSSVVDFVDYVNFKGTANYTSQYVYDRSTGILYYDQDPLKRGYTAVLANLSQSDIIPEEAIFVI